MQKPSDKLLKLKKVDSLNRAIQSPVELPRYSQLIYFLFYFFSAYLVIPIINIPLLGLSLSAPLFFMIAVACFVKPPQPWFKEYRFWIFLAISLWMGIFFSAVAVGLLSAGVDIDREGVLTLIRYIYWLIVFVITAYFTSQGQVLKKTALVLGVTVTALALIRLGEAILFGNIGSGVNNVVSQNVYGLLFSTFSPYALIWIFGKRGRTRFLSLIGYAIILSAVAINGSRGSWVAIGIGVVLTFIMLFISNPRKFARLLVVALLISTVFVILWNAVPQIASGIQTRLNTFQSLDEDKSYVIRELMVQKGLRLFKESPIFGVGADRFTKTSTELDIPRVLMGVNLERYDRKSTHNSYIVVLAEYGLAGAIPFAILMIALLGKGFFSTIKFLRGEEFIYLAVFISLVQMSIHFWVIASLTNTSTWFVYGLSAAAIMISKRDRH